MDYTQKAREIMEMLPKMKHTHNSKVVEMVSKGECHMLGLLCMNQGRMMSGEIAKEMKVSTARVAAAIKSLEEKGYVTRNAVEGDRRKTLVLITDSGRELSMDLYKNAMEHTARYLEYLGEEDTENLLRIINKTKGFFEQ